MEVGLILAVGFAVTFALTNGDSKRSTALRSNDDYLTSCRPSARPSRAVDPAALTGADCRALLDLVQASMVTAGIE